MLQYKDEDYLPDAFINFLALLGWNPGDDREIFSRIDLIKTFDIARIQKSGAQMNAQKLDWINKEHLKLLSPEEIQNKIFEYLPENMHNEKLVPIIFERISKWGDIQGMVGELGFFFKSPQFSKEKLLYKNTSPEKISSNLKIAVDKLSTIDEKDFTTENIKNILIQVADQMGNRGELLHPVRMALSGLDKSPDPFIIASILGKNETLSRLQKAI